jgi:hypothetical protein
MHKIDMAMDVYALKLGLKADCFLVSLQVGLEANCFSVCTHDTTLFTLTASS